MENQTTLYQDDEQHNTTLRRQNHNKRKQLKDSIYMKITYLDLKQEKIYREVILGQPKITLSPI
jgi:hypothetical protein